RETARGNDEMFSFEADPPEELHSATVLVPRRGRRRALARGFVPFCTDLIAHFGHKVISSLFGSLTAALPGRRSEGRSAANADSGQTDRECGSAGFETRSSPNHVANDTAPESGPIEWPRHVAYEQINPPDGGLTIGINRLQADLVK